MAKPTANEQRPAAPANPSGSALKGDTARELRLAAALRANLRRRKAGARAKPANGEGRP